MSSFVLLSGQLLKDIPWSVLSEVIMHLNNPSPLRNNWKAVAAELSLSFQTVQSLDHHVSGGMTEGVLQIMFQRKMTVQDFANMMEKIQRPDIVDILIKAGLPENNIGQENKNGMVQSSWMHACIQFNDVIYKSRDILLVSALFIKKVSFSFRCWVISFTGLINTPSIHLFILSCPLWREIDPPRSVLNRPKWYAIRYDLGRVAFFSHTFEQNGSIFSWYQLIAKNQDKHLLESKSSWDDEYFICFSIGKWCLDNVVNQISFLQLSFGFSNAFSLRIFGHLSLVILKTRVRGLTIFYYHLL